MAGPAVQVDGLAEFRRELRNVDVESAKELKKAHQRISTHVRGRARSNANAAGGAFAAAKAAINGRFSEVSAGIGVSRGRAVPFAQATFWGAKRRTGWYAADKYGESTGEQFPEWVGNDWEAAKPNQGPYVINYTVAEEIPLVMDEYGQSIEAMFAKAFPSN